MKSIVFDAGPVISLTTNNLLWVLEGLRRRYSGEFLISREVRRELIDVPIETKRFKLEALQVNEEITKGILKVVDDPNVKLLKEELSNLANNCFIARGTPIKIVHEGEMGSVALALLNDSDAIVIDERTTRELIERPEKLAGLMSNKLHVRIDVDRANLDNLKAKLSGLKVIRSIELALIGYELGWFDRYLTQDKDARKILKEAILWGIKIRGASISQEEIDKIVRLEK